MMNLHLPRTMAALLAALTLTFNAAAWADGPQMLLKPSGEEQNHLLLQQLPRLGFYSQFVQGQGAHVTGVRHGSEAARLGLEAGDMIVGINGQKLMSKHDWNTILADIVYNQPEDDVVLFGAQQNGPQALLLKPKLQPENSQIITLHIRDWRTGMIALRKTNLQNWE